MVEPDTGNGKLKPLIYAITGGIASGKTTVAGMFEKLGAPTIDYDILARVVVEPGRPALKEIEDHFGSDVLQEDGGLNRKKMSEIVFGNPLKRQKLESFIYPRLPGEYQKQVQQHLTENPEAIVQVVVPLLIERNMQSMFHQILVVYIPREEQAKRLMERDNISHEMAMNIINAQMSIEEKRAYADMLIDNSGGLEKTEKQVQEVWGKLCQVQVERSA